MNLMLKNLLFAVAISAFMGCQHEEVLQDGELPNSANILNFSLKELELKPENIEIDKEKKVVLMRINTGAYLNRITPIFSLSKGAVSQPKSGTVINLTRVLDITVTAQNKNDSSKWYVIVLNPRDIGRELNTEANLLSFVVSGFNMGIDTVKKTIMDSIPSDFDLRGAMPHFNISEGAKLFIEEQEIISTHTNINLDFNRDYKVKIVSEDWSQTNTFNLRIGPITPKDDENDARLSSVLIDLTDIDNSISPDSYDENQPTNYIKSVFSSLERSKTLYVPYDTDLSRMALFLDTYNQNATIEPASGSVQDFGDGKEVRYIVTAKNGTNQTHYVFQVKKASVNFIGDRQNQYTIKDYNGAIANVNYSYPYDADLKNINLVYYAPPGMRLYDSDNRYVESGNNTVDLSNTKLFRLKNSNGVLMASYFLNLSKN